MKKAILSLGFALTALSLSACNNQSTQNSQGDQNTTSSGQAQTVELLNVSYDVSRDFYKDFNPLFVNHYKTASPNTTVTIKQSHGGASKQALSVVNGLQADVVTMNQTSDIDTIVKADLINPDWTSKLPNNAVPFTTTMVFLVRNGNPKGIKDWNDLAKSGVGVVMPNPKTSGTARYAFLGAYGYGLHTLNGDETKTKSYMGQVLSNVTNYDNGARASTVSFTQRGIGDVLITTENEAHHVATHLAKGDVEIVYPSYSIAIYNPVAVVDSVVDKKGTRQVAHDYLSYLYSDEAQELAAKLYFRPSNEAILQKYADQYPQIQTFNPNEVFGSWDDIMGKFFKEGGVFDELAIKK